MRSERLLGGEKFKAGIINDFAKKLGHEGKKAAVPGGS